MAGQIRPYILGIGGTTRPGSSTERALQAALAAAAAEGAETGMIGGAELQLPMYDPAIPGLPKQAEHLVAEVRRCHGLVIASPGYHGTISGMVKNAIDYIEELRGDAAPYLDGRAVGCIAAAYGWQATGTTLVALRSIVHALRGWPTPLGVGINSALPVFGPNGACIDETVSFQLQLVGRQVVEFARMRLTAAHAAHAPAAS
ncbi:MAG: NAD(P)H-dependent oxidoreductase [Alphaproteobacteria bacterium]|nr:NAD(P)H-dependent oxidoreductase [Alphaproteobacteria bacterium]